MIKEPCRIHPDREYGISWGFIKLCYACEVNARKEIAVDSYSAGFQDALLRWVEKQLRIFCPGCAWDEALIEDAMRELDFFTQEVDNTVRGGFE